MPQLAPRTLFVGVVILAAGASRRMGRPKLLLPWGKTSVLGHLLQQWNRLRAAQVATVCAPESAPLFTELNRLGFPAANRIFNPAPDGGMFSSIQCAARWPRWNPALTHWLITLGDQPQLAESTLQALLDFGARNPARICQPMRAQRRKHPVLLPKQFFHELRDTPASNLKVFLVKHENDLAGFVSDDSGLDFDMDTPEDYERLTRLFAGNTGSAGS